MGIKEKLEEARDTIPQGVKLIAVSKTKPIELILEAYNCGQIIFGENKVQEMIPKHEALPKDIKWHFIGHLQSNKVKYIAPFVDTIHSVDSLKLLKEINKQAISVNRVINVLLQVHIAQEDSKFGLSKEDLDAILGIDLINEFPGVKVIGLMGMATNTDNCEIVGKEFESLKLNFDLAKSRHFINNDYFSEISMGMSGDYKIAIEKGSTMVRLGSSIFGARNYG